MAELFEAEKSIAYAHGIGLIRTVKFARKVPEHRDLGAVLHGAIIHIPNPDFWNIIRVMKPRRMRWVVHVAHLG
jgi:hypothetical protein